jgi:hydrogenase maturation protease
MARILIVGFGNPLRSDDGLGPRVAEELLRNPLPAAEILVRHQLTPELAETVAHAELVLFVDATRRPGSDELRCVRVDASVATATFTHELTPAAILSLAEKVYGTSPPAFEVSLHGECFDLGERFSPKIAEKLPALVDFVRNFVAQSAVPG